MHRDLRTTGAPQQRGWATRRANQHQKRLRNDAAWAMLRTVEQWLAVLESDVDEIEVVTHGEMLSQVREVLSQFPEVLS